MVCHSNDFMDEILAEKLGSSEVSDYLREQIYQLDCSQFDRLCRAFAQSEIEGRFTAVERGEFKGELTGYGHMHCLADDWLAANVAHALGFPFDSELDQTIELAVDEHIQTGMSVAEMVGLVRDRMQRKATGYWVIYSGNEPGNRRYLAIHPHVRAGSQQEVELRQLLDKISSSFHSQS